VRILKRSRRLTPARPALIEPPPRESMARLYRSCSLREGGVPPPRRMFAFARPTFSVRSARPAPRPIHSVLSGVSRLQCPVLPTLVDGLRAPAVEGHPTPDQAFNSDCSPERLLKVKFLDDTTVRSLADSGVRCRRQPLDPPTGGRIARTRRVRQRHPTDFRVAQVIMGGKNFEPSNRKGMPLRTLQKFRRTRSEWRSCP